MNGAASVLTTASLFEAADPSLQDIEDRQEFDRIWNSTTVEEFWKQIMSPRAHPFDPAQRGPAIAGNVA